jgi:hypothetical protein
MDAKVQWKISAKVETLIESIVACRKELFNAVKVRNPGSRSLKLLFCDVHASPKLTELLQLSHLWKDHKETAAEIDQRRANRPHSQEMVADIELFKLVKDTIIGDEQIRVVCEFGTGEGTWESFIGNVELVSR